MLVLTLWVFENLKRGMLAILYIMNFISCILHFIWIATNYT